MVVGDVNIAFKGAEIIVVFDMFPVSNGARKCQRMRKGSSQVFGKFFGDSKALEQLVSYGILNIPLTQIWELSF